MHIRSNQSELLQKMGSLATTEEAKAMTELLAERGIYTFAQLSEDLTDEEFFALIPVAIAKAS